MVKKMNEWNVLQQIPSFSNIIDASRTINDSIKKLPYSWLCIIIINCYTPKYEQEVRDEYVTVTVLSTLDVTRADVSIIILR